MSDQELPTEDDIRRAWWLSPDNPADNEGASDLAFDAWLASVRDEAHQPRVIERAKADAWDEGYEAAATFHEPPRKGNWQNDTPRPGLRQWVDEPAPSNPYRVPREETTP